MKARLILRLVAAVVILAYMAAPAEANRSRTHGMSFTHHTGSFSGSGGFSVSHHKTRVFFGNFANHGFFFSRGTRGNFFFGRDLSFRRVVVLNPGPVPPFSGNNQFFSGTIVPSFTIGTPINAFFVPRSSFFRNNGFNFGFFSSGFSSGFRTGNEMFSNFGPFGLTGGSGNQTVLLLVNTGPAVIPASVPVAASPVKAQIVVLHTWPGADKVKIFAPTASAQASGSPTAMQIAEVPAQ
jgi:hypothetical protein